MIEAAKALFSYLYDLAYREDPYEAAPQNMNAEDDAIRSFYLDVPVTHTIKPSESAPQKVELPFIGEQLSTMDESPRYDLRRLRADVLYAEDSSLAYDDYFYRKACLADQFIDLLNEEGLISDEMICPITMSVIKHPVRLGIGQRIYDFAPLHAYLSRNSQVDREGYLIFKDLRTNLDYRGEPTVMTDVSFCKLAEEKLDALLHYIQNRYESNADEMQNLAWHLDQPSGEKFNLPASFYSAQSGKLLLRPIRLTDGRVIDRAEYTTRMGAYIYALDLMKSMESFSETHKKQLHPSNTFYCPY